MGSKAAERSRKSTEARKRKAGGKRMPAFKAGIPAPMSSRERQRLIDEYLARGGKITKVKL